MREDEYLPISLNKSPVKKAFKSPQLKKILQKVKGPSQAIVFD